MKRESTELQKSLKRATWISAGAACFWLLIWSGSCWWVRGALPPDNVFARILAILAVLGLLAIIPVIVNLRARLKEIDGGEYDAASQY